MPSKVELAQREFVQLSKQELSTLVNKIKASSDCARCWRYVGPKSDNQVQLDFHELPEWVFQVIHDKWMTRRASEPHYAKQLHYANRLLEAVDEELRQVQKERKRLRSIVDDGDRSDSFAQ